MQFGTYISQRRKELGISQKELANRILKEDGGPISPQYLNDIERNRRNPPSGDLLRQLAEQLSISLDYLSFLAGQFPAMDDTIGRSHEPETVEAAFVAFRKVLRGDR